MSGLFFIDSIQSWLHRRSLQKIHLQAAQWPITTAEVNHWAVLTADKDAASTATPYQIEASFHFTVNGEYYGGYLRSVAMTHHEAETKAKGTPTVNIRYNPAHPDTAVALAEDNAGKLPFRIFSYTQKN
jgi:hypothetical protein